MFCTDFSFKNSIFYNLFDGAHMRIFRAQGTLTVTAGQSNK